MGVSFLGDEVTVKRDEMEITFPLNLMKGKGNCFCNPTGKNFLWYRSKAIIARCSQFGSGRAA